MRTHGKRQEAIEARRRVDLRERLPRGATVLANSIGRLAKRSSKPVRSGSLCSEEEETRTHARGGARARLKRLRPDGFRACRRRRVSAFCTSL